MKPSPFCRQACITLKTVSKTYPGQATPVIALKDIDLQVNQGDFLVIAGKSGAGKTTLVNVLTGLDRATSGEIWVDGAELATHGYGYVRAHMVESTNQAADGVVAAFVVNPRDVPQSTTVLT